MPRTPIVSTKRGIELLERVSDIDPACELAYCHRILAHVLLGEHESAEQMFYLVR